MSRTRRIARFLRCVPLLAVPVLLVAISGANEEPRGEPVAVPVADRTVHEVEVRRPAGPPRVRVAAADGSLPVELACATCHATRPPNRSSRSTADLDEFHQGLVVAHGDNRCLACHNPSDYDSLRLADDRALAFVDVMQLCAQCHGGVARDYAHGAHGGMTGYWDLRRGARVRNNCVDCHDPHSPAIPPMVPTFKPRDRFLAPAADHANDGGRAR